MKVRAELRRTVAQIAPTEKARAMTELIARGMVEVLDAPEIFIGMVQRRAVLQEWSPSVDTSGLFSVLSNTNACHSRPITSTNRRRAEEAF